MQSELPWRSHQVPLLTPVVLKRRLLAIPLSRCTSTMKGMQKMQSMPMTGNMDRDFATMMREHHMQGVEMAKMELKHGKSPEMKRMAENIIKDQQKEIAQFDQWLAKQK